MNWYRMVINWLGILISFDEMVGDSDIHDAIDNCSSCDDCGVEGVIIYDSSGR